MKIFNALMQNEQIKRAVLIEFGFGYANPKKVVNWVKKQFPEKYVEIADQIKMNSIVTDFMPREVELTSRSERDKILNNFEKVLDKVRR